MMKKQCQMLSILLILFVVNNGLLGIEADQGQSSTTSNVKYFQVSDTMDQLGGSNLTTAEYDSIDGVNGITIYKNGTFSYSSEGFFFALFACQIGSPNRNGKGEVHVWVQRNLSNASTVGNLPFSNTIQTIERGFTAVLAFQSIVKTFVGLTARVVFSTLPNNSCSTLGLIATEPENEPVVPSIIVSLIQFSTVNNPTPLAQLNSIVTQLGSLTAKAVKFTVIAQSYGIDVTGVGNDGSIKYNESGLYFAIVRAQVGSANDTSAAGEVHLWMRINGGDIPNSNTIQTIRNGSSTILISQTVVKFKSNDKLQVMFSSTNNKLGLIASAPKNEPATSSAVFSTFKLDRTQNSIPYAQLSSLVTQYGCVTPQAVQFDQNDGSKNIKNKNGTLTFQKSGTYFLVAAAQVGSEGSQGVGDVHLWMSLNGEDMPNSNTIQTVNADTSVLICQTAIELNAGDKVQVRFSTDVSDGKLGLIAKQPQNEPAVPSIIFSAFQSII